MDKEEIKRLISGNASLAGNPQEQNVQQTLMPQNERQMYNPQYDVKSIAEKDILTIQNLVEAGKIDSTQGQYLVNYVINKAYDMVKNNTNRNQGYAFQPSFDGIKEFENEHQGFFNRDGRSDVLNYLKNSSCSLDKDEVSKISQMIKNIERCAVERYLKQTAHEKTLNDENEIAKMRLRANAQNANFDDTQTRVFTREQIGKMSGAEFAKYEKAIMEQLRKGLIR